MFRYSFHQKHFTLFTDAGVYDHVVIFNLLSRGDIYVRSCVCLSEKVLKQLTNYGETCNEHQDELERTSDVRSTVVYIFC